MTPQPTMRFVIAAIALVPLVILLAPAFLVAFALWGFANTVRTAGRVIEPPFVPWTELMVFDAALGWKPRPNLRARYLADRDDIFDVVTDANGWPGTGNVENSPLIVIGDSFAFGYGVNTGKSFADLPSDLSIKAIGAPGYSMVQGVLLMEQFAHSLAGKLVVWFICLENDLQDNMLPAMRRYRAPFLRPRMEAGWEIARDHVSPKPWRCSDLGKRRILANLCVPGPLADRAFDACDFLIAQGASVCRAAGASLAVVTIPDPSQLSAAGRMALAAASGNAEQFDADLPERRIAEICRRHGIHVVIGSQHLMRSDYKVMEALHWNERGHRRIAKVLVQLHDLHRSGILQDVSVLDARIAARVARLGESRTASA